MLNYLTHVYGSWTQKFGLSYQSYIWSEKKNNNNKTHWDYPSVKNKTNRYRMQKRPLIDTPPFVEMFYQYAHKYMLD